MKLYGVKGWGSVLVEAMLAVAGVDYEFVDVDGFDSPSFARDKLVAVNPLAQVPTLVLDDGTIMTESAAIALYLSETAAGEALAPPPGSPERARFLRYLVWIVANVYPTFTFGDYPERWTSDAEGLRSAVLSRRMMLWRWFDGEVGTLHVLGDRFSVLDIYVAVMINWRPNRPWFDKDAPHLAAVADAAARHPAVAPVLARNFPDAAA